MEIPDSNKMKLAVISVQHDGTMKSERVGSLAEAVAWLEDAFQDNADLADDAERDAGVIMLHFDAVR